MILHTLTGAYTGFREGGRGGALCQALLTKPTGFREGERGGALCQALLTKPKEAAAIGFFNFIII